MLRWLRKQPKFEDMLATWEILLEENSTSTQTNAIFSLKLLREHTDHQQTPRSLCIATNPFHRYRSWLTFKNIAASEPSVWGELEIYTLQ
ncbi:unnamed protein product, partial [Polarella glacialis]